jgi:hypothetical protein
MGEIPDVIDAQLGHQPVYVVVREDDAMPGIIARCALTHVPGTADTLLLVTGRAHSARTAP